MYINIHTYIPLATSADVRRPAHPRARLARVRCCFSLLYAYYCLYTCYVLFHKVENSRRKNPRIEKFGWAPCCTGQSDPSKEKVQFE